MNNQPTALIVLSTYNGAKFLAAQLDSLISQSFTNWVLLVRDDGSSDSTCAILNRYAQSDQRIIAISDQLGNLNIKKSFSELMRHACERNEDYIFFCDQDDVWLPNKLDKQIDLLTKLQQQSTAETPLLVHSDLCVVDEDLRVIHSSFIQHEHLVRNETSPLQTLLINNYVTGCTIGMNRALIKIATPIPDESFMHDWWCALCAAAMGKIGFIADATILYRQHLHNSIGSSGFYGKFKELKSFNKSILKRQHHLRMCFKQATALLSRVNAHQYYIQRFVSLMHKNKLSRYFSAMTLQLKPAGKIRTFVFWMFLGWV